MSTVSCYQKATQNKPVIKVGYIKNNRNIKNGK